MGKKDPTIELFEAVEEQQSEKVVRALNHGGDPNGVDEEARRYGITPVHAACMGSKTDILRLLVTYGGKVSSLLDQTNHTHLPPSEIYSCIRTWHWSSAWLERRSCCCSVLNNGRQNSGCAARSAERRA